MAVTRIESVTSWSADVTTEIPFEDPGFHGAVTEESGSYVDANIMQEWVDAVAEVRKLDIDDTQEERQIEGLQEHLEPRARHAITESSRICFLGVDCALEVGLPGIATGDVSKARMVLTCAVKGLESEEKAQTIEQHCRYQHAAASEEVETHAGVVTSNLARGKRMKENGDSAYAEAVSEL